MFFYRAYDYTKNHFLARALWLIPMACANGSSVLTRPPSPGPVTAIAWHAPLQVPAGIAQARELMATYAIEPTGTVDAQAVQALLRRLGGKWKAERYDGADAKFKAQQWGWALRKLMANAPCSLAYAADENVHASMVSVSPGA